MISKENQMIAQQSIYNAGTFTWAHALTKAMIFCLSLLVDRTSASNHIVTYCILFNRMKKGDDRVCLGLGTNDGGRIHGEGNINKWSGEVGADMIS